MVLTEIILNLFPIRIVPFFQFLNCFLWAGGGTTVYSTSFPVEKKQLVEEDGFGIITSE